ncbi:MAG: FkbM family methyltransferase [Candidatus Paceibacterota bacterium]|jgi:FkbM family methyltransferase
MILAQVRANKNIERIKSIMNFAREIWKLTKNFALIARGRQGDLFFVYLRLEFKYLFLVKLLKRPLKSERLLGWTIKFFDYTTFLYMFEEVFIGQEYFFETTEASPLIIDGGSNIGMSIFYFKKLWPNCQIISFEPDRQTFAVLADNVKTNKLTGITLHNLALADKPGSLNFYSDQEQPGSLIASTTPRHPGQNYETVQSATLSEKVTGPVDFLKLDIEGAETEVIGELAQTKKIKLLKNICLEYHHHIKRDEDRLSEILTILEKNGFGYQLSTVAKPPMKKRKFQDILIYAYSK